MSHISRFIYHMNNYCNLHCEHCSDFSHIPIDPDSSLIERRVKWQTSIEEVELFCQRFHGVAMDKYVHLTGGEPTAIPVDLLDAVLNVFHQWGRRVLLLTNGYNLFEVNQTLLNTVDRIKLDDHGTNTEHIHDCIEYLKTFYKGTVEHIETFNHFPLGKTRKLPCNKGGHCGRKTLKTKIEVLIKQGTVYPCCAMASFDLYENNTQLETALRLAGWNLENKDIAETLKNWKKTLPEYAWLMCRDGCWWPYKRILGAVPITLKRNDVIRKQSKESAVSSYIF